MQAEAGLVVERPERTGQDKPAGTGIYLCASEHRSVLESGCQLSSADLLPLEPAVSQLQIAGHLGALESFPCGAKRAVAVEIHGALGGSEFVQCEMLEPELRQVQRTNRSAAVEAGLEPQPGLVELRAERDAQSSSGFQLERTGERAAQGF